DEGFRVFFLRESESSGRATVKRQVLAVLHLIHAHSVVTAGHGTALIDVICLRRVNHLRGRVVAYGDETHRLMLLARFAYRTLWATRFPPLSTDLDHDAQFVLQGTLAKSTRLRCAKLPVLVPAQTEHRQHYEAKYRNPCFLLCAHLVLLSAAFRPWHSSCGSRNRSGSCRKQRFVRPALIRTVRQCDYRTAAPW